MVQNRTIKHPGFEYFETENYNFSSQSNTKSDALSIGYCAQGPIGEPVRISSLSQFIKVFGKPENDQEFYLYKGVESVVSRGRTIVVVRMPYDNSLSEIKKKEQDGQTFNKYFKVLKCNFAIANDSTAKYNDLQTAYRNNVTFKTIEVEPDLVSFDDIIHYNAGQFDDDFIIINKFNDRVLKNGEEYIVSIYGTGNALRQQSLSYDVVNPEQINYFKLNNNGTSVIFDEDDVTKLTFAKNKVYWQTNGDVTINDEALTVAHSYFDDCVQYVPTIPTYDDFIKENIPGIPSSTVVFYTDTMIEMISGNEEEYKSLFKSPDTAIEFAEINYDGEIDSSVPTTFNLNGAFIEAVNIPKKTNFENDALWYMNSTFRLNYYENGKLSRSYPLQYIQSTEYGKAHKWKLSFKEQFARVKLTEEQLKNGLGEYIYFVDQANANNITIVVSKITQSSYETGRYIFEPVEVFSGSIYKGSVNHMTQQSNYIGDIVNYNSNIISFYGKQNYNNYDYKTDSILVEQTTPYRLAVINNGRKNTKTTDVLNLNKIIIKQDAIDAGATLDDVLNDLLSKVKNNIKFTYRDVYDFGLTSVLTYITPNINNEYYYESSYFNSSELSGTQFLNVGIWKRYVKSFTRHCQYNHKYSMFHADGPRKLVLNGDLSRAEDLKQDQLETVITGKKAQLISIRDCTYGQTNIQWIEVYNDVTYNNTWIPCSIKLASNITYNDIINNIWDAPAGHRYGMILNHIRLAINPGYDLCDRLYSNCLNYAITWPNGTTTIEGQKTQLLESSSALNRINVRRLMIYLERFAQTVSVKYLYQPNTSYTREYFVSDLNTEFSRIKNLGGLYSYRIICDEQNNSPQVIDNNELRVSILLQPAKTLEFVVAQFIVTKTGVSLEEIDAASF